MGEPITLAVWEIVGIAVIALGIGFIIGMFTGAEISETTHLRGRIRSAHLSHEAERSEWTREKERLERDYATLINGLRQRAALRRKVPDDEDGPPAA